MTKRTLRWTALAATATGCLFVDTCTAVLETVWAALSIVDIWA